MSQAEIWHKKRQYTQQDFDLALKALDAIRSGMSVRTAVRLFPLPDGRGFLAKHTLVAAYYLQVESGEWEADPSLLARIRMKPIRTLSGVTTITVLTKPSPCPGNCIFCPTEAHMPQSYLSDEPGARRGLENEFDPYRQVSSRLTALHQVGHPTDKIELLVLGGSWDAYPRSYQQWFIRRCFEALNEVNPDDTQPLASLESAHTLNVNSKHRNVGLVVETRPDLINPKNLVWYRKLGVTKVQLGAQSLDDRILALNRRGHTAAQTLEAVSLLRAGGFKIVLHWMPNLLGATLDSDREDFARIWLPESLNPDELKIYPCQLLENSDLFKVWQQGDYTPFTEQELISLIADLKETVPRYCRINRVIRDIPSTHVVAGNRNTSLRQDVALELQQRGTHCECIRCREVRGQSVVSADLNLQDETYQAAYAEEHFISYNTKDDKLVGYLRLSLPKKNNLLGLSDLAGAAIIREVHVYGQSLEVGSDQEGAAQHIGLGTRLIEEAESVSKMHGFARLAVISAVGTRAYYAARGFDMGELYMVKPL